MEEHKSLEREKKMEEKSGKGDTKAGVKKKLNSFLITIIYFIVVGLSGFSFFFFWFSSRKGCRKKIHFL